MTHALVGAKANMGRFRFLARGITWLKKKSVMIMVGLRFMVDIVDIKSSGISCIIIASLVSKVS